MHKNTSPLALLVVEIRNDYIEKLKQIQKLDYKLRTTREESEREIEDFLCSLLDTLDGYDRMIEMVDSALRVDDKKARRVLKNFISLRKEFTRVLKQFGLTSMDVQGEFVPGLHKAVDTEITSEIPDGNIIRLVKAGYYWRNKVLRPAEVVVATSITGEES